MKRALRRILLFVVFTLSGSALTSAFAQVGPQGPRGTQLGRDPGRPMIAICANARPCQFVGLVDPGGFAIGPLILDKGYFSVCTPGSCGVPTPFLVTPAFLGGTAIAAGAGGVGGLSAGTIGAIAGTTAAAIGGAVGGTLASRGDDPVQTGSQ